MNVENFFVDKSQTILEAIKKLDKLGKKIVLVVENKYLLGVVTDGDFRRWVLNGGSLSDSIEKIMNSKAKFIFNYEIDKAESVMKKYGIEALPVLDCNKNVEDIIFLNENYHSYKTSHMSLENVPIVIMAGGKGTRLYPYTKVLPKPLIPIGDLTILERIMNRFTEYGAKNFYLTVNYKKNMIKAYLKDKDCYKDVNYIEEEKFLGTGGSLYLLNDIIMDTFILSNCDILVEADYGDIIKQHKENGNLITMVTSLKSYIIPYGVIDVGQGGNILSIMEKPEYNFQVNTGFYILEPQIINDIPKNTFFHITELINNYVKQGKKVGVYPITNNSWMDMGEIKEMEEMVLRLKC